jgi:hypothetical protein
VHRRELLRGLALTTIALPGLAWADDHSVGLSAAFPYLEKFLAYPAAGRNRFYIAYVARRGFRPAPDYRGVIVDGNGQRAPLSLDGAGRVTRLPTLAELRGGAKLICGGPFADVKLTPEIRLSQPIAPNLDAHDLGLAVAQLNVAVAAMAGMMSMVIPKFDTVFFPDGGGQLVYANGKVAALPVAATHYLGAVPYFMPTAATAAGVREVVLTKLPSRMLIGIHAKT